MRGLSLTLIRMYQAVLSPFFRGMCRYEPSCSRYAYDSVERFGCRRGWWLAVRRLSRCRPFGGHGWDPVPEDYVSWRQRRRARRAGAIGRGGLA
ncbi:MAG: membrane protein insertion efficiency factor YidD [Candidatus Dormibacteria bacterium]